MRTSALAAAFLLCLFAQPASAQYADIFSSPTDAFAHKDGPLQVVRPNGGEHWVEGNSYAVTWTAASLEGTVDVYLVRDAERIATIAEDVPAQRGTASWTPPAGFAKEFDNNEFGEYAMVRAVVRQEASGEYDTSDSLFSVEPALPATAQGRFRDVPATHPNAAAIEFVRAQGYVAGYPDGAYRPDATINRAEFVKIVTLYKFGQEMIDQCGSGALFTDVPGGEWYQKYVCRARDAHLIGGYPDGSFQPERRINFAEAAKIIAITEAYNAGDPVLPEYLGGPWYTIYVQFLGEHGAIPPEIASHDRLITRGDMAEILYRLKAKPGKPSRPASDLLTVSPDVCKDGPIDSRLGAGMAVYPKDPAYAQLEYLGELFTADACGAVRFRAIYRDASREVGPYPFLTLRGKPSNGLRSVLEDQGYRCHNEELFHCAQWQHPGSVTLRSLLDLKPYAKEFAGFSCPNCY